jgi:lysophospholipase L1-like esterase
MDNQAASAESGCGTRHHSPMRSALLGALALASMALCRSPALAQDHSWVGTWAASPQPIWGEDFIFPTKIPATADNQTIRQIVRASLGGSRVRIIFSNEYGARPLTIGAASVALAGDGPAISADTLHKVTFGGRKSAVVPPGAPIISDPVELRIREASHLAVSLYLPDETLLTTFHWDGKQTTYFGSGDLTNAGVFHPTDTTDARVFLSGVLVDTPNQGAVLVFGDSITDGNGASLNADTRWPDYLARRLASQNVAVLNAGISGARLLQDKMGANGPARFNRDVLAQPGVKAVIVLMGINDISWPGTAFARQQKKPTTASLISAYQQLIALARAHNLRIVGATLTPFEGALSGTPLGDFYNADKDALRQQVNHWIRTSGAFDAIIDFDALLRDPAHPSRLAAHFDSGDHLHPGDKGNQAMAEAVNLDALFGNTFANHE